MTEGTTIDRTMNGQNERIIKRITKPNNIQFYHDYFVDYMGMDSDWSIVANTTDLPRELGDYVFLYSMALMRKVRFRLYRSNMIKRGKMYCGPLVVDKYRLLCQYSL
mgnify:CR=1 FL=1